MRDPLPVPGPLATGDVHVWTVKLDPAHIDSSAVATLDAHERERAARFVFDRDRIAFTLGHAALRVILARYLDVAPANVAFSAGPNGKPELDVGRYPNSLRFNMSGSGNLSLIAIARGRDVGVDVEQVRPMHDLDGVVGIVLSARERVTFAAQDESERLAFFLDVWTRKEAYFKALGEGLKRPLTRLDCGAATDTIRDADDPAAVKRWHVTGWRIAGYHAALAVQTPIGQLSFKSWTS